MMKKTAILTWMILAPFAQRVAAQQNPASALKLEQPAANAVLGVAKVSISGSYDGELASVSCGDREGVVFGSRFVVESVPLAEGTNHVVVQATDLDGQRLEAALDLVCDLTAPRVKLVEPKAGAILGVFRTRVSGTVTDATAVSLRVNGLPVEVQRGRFEVDVPLLEGANTVRVEAADAAGHASEATAAVTVDATAPHIFVARTWGQVTRQSAFTVSGRVEDATAASLTANGKLVSLDADGRFSFSHQLPAQGAHTITLVARDKAGHTSDLPLKVVLDTRAPALAGIDPAPGSPKVPLASPISLRFSEPVASGTVVVTLADGRVVPGTQSVQRDRIIFKPAAPLPDGAQITVRATGITDVAGNPLSTPVESRFTTADTTPPPELVLDPVPVSTPRSTVTISGRTEPNARLRVGSRLTTADSSGRFRVDVPLRTGTQNRIGVMAADGSGNRSPLATAAVTQQSGAFGVLSAAYLNNRVTVTFTRDVDSATVHAQSVSVRSANGLVAGQLATLGSQVEFTPDVDLTSTAFLLEITTAVADLGANPLAYPYTRMFNRPAGGMTVTGEVYDDTTGLPLEGALVTAATINGAAAPAPAPSITTGADGRFVLSVDGSSCTLAISKPSYTSASRSVISLSQLAETVFDVRLSPRRVEGDTTLTPAGGTVMIGSVRLDVPAHSVPVEKKINLTVVSAQGLAERLPMGWSPALVLDLSEITFPQPVVLTADPALTAAAFRALNLSVSFTLVRWDEATLSWQVLATGTTLVASLTRGGQYAWLVPDAIPAAPPTPVVGQALKGLPDSTLPADVTSSLAFLPGQIMAGGTATARETVSTPSGIASGVPMQAQFSELYEMLDGQTVTYPLYIAGLRLHSFGGTQSVMDFSVSPNRQVTMQNLLQGTVTTAIFRYAVDAAASVVGAAGGRVAGDGGAEIEIPAGALAAPTTVTVKNMPSALLPVAVPEGFRLVGAVELSLGGAVLAIPASLSVPPSATVTDGAMLVAARVVSPDSILSDSVTYADNRLATPGSAPTGFAFTGVREGGVYLFLEAVAPMGFATGIVRDQGLAVASARVRAEGQGLTAIANSSAQYAQIAPAGTARLRATHPTTGDEGTAEQALTAGALITADINVQPTGPRVVGQSPSSGATNVPLATRVQIIFSEAVDPATLTPQTFYVAGVTGSITLSADGLLAEFKPAQDFASSQTFTMTAKGTITDLRGTPMGTDYTSTFTTADIIPPTYDLKKIRVVLPTNGVIRVIGEPGAIEPGATIWLFNERSGASVSTQGLSDGSFDISIPAIEDDRVRIRVIDLASNEIEVTPDVYTTPDGRGVQLDSGAHSYITPDGLGIRTGLGTFAEALIVRLDPVTDTSALVQPPEYLSTLSAFRLSLEGHSAYKELRLSIPAPTNLAPDAQLFIAREVTVLGQRMLMVMDTCAVTDGRIEVQSPPWPGVRAEGLYTFVVNQGMQLAFVEGLIMSAGPAVAMIGTDLAFVADPFISPWFIMPVPVSRTVTLTIRDSVTGVLLFTGEVATPTTAGQTYQFTEPLVSDFERPRIYRSAPVPVLDFQWLGRTITASGIEIVATDSQTIQITGSAGKAAPLGHVYLYRYTTDPLTLRERVDKSEAVADAGGGFILRSPVRVPDRLLLLIEKDGAEVWPVFELDFTEPVKAISSLTSLDQTATIVDAETGVETACTVSASASTTHLTIRPVQALREERQYALKLTNLTDAAGNTYDTTTPLLLPFRTRKSTMIGVEPVGRIDSLVLYGEYIFAASGDSGVQVLDASDPGDLKVVGNFTGALEARALALYYDATNKPWLVVVGGGARFDGYIKILDITNPRVPAQTKSQVISYPIGFEGSGYANLAIDQGKPQRVRVAGHYAFVAIHGAGMMIVDLERMSASTDLTPECLVGWYPEEWISELEVIKDGATTRVLLLVDYLGLKMLNVTNTAAITLEGVFLGESRAEAGGKHFNGLALAFGLEPDSDGDGRLGEAELLDDDGALPAAPQDLAFITIPANQEVLTIDITSRTGVPPESDLPPRVLSDGTKLPPEHSTGSFPMIGNVKLTGATALGQIAFSAKDRILYVLDATLGVIRISMNQPAGFTMPGQPDPRVLGTIPTAGRPRYGLILDEKLNMAYAGDLDTGLVPIKLAPPRLRVGLKVDGKFVEFNPLIPDGLPQSAYPAAYPTDRRIYLLVHLPKKAAELGYHVQVGLRSLLQATDPSPLWSGQAGFVDGAIAPTALTLHPYKNDDGSDPKPEDEGYELFVSDPITLTSDPKTTRGGQELKLLAGDLLEMRFGPEAGQIFAVSPLDSTAGYLTEADTKALVWRVPAYRVEWEDGAEPEPAQNASIGAPASVPGLAGSGTAGVFLHSGEAFMEETDLFVRGRGLDFAVTRTYNAHAIYSGPLGWGWDYGYHKRLQEMPGGNVYYFDGHGRKDLFTMAGGTYTPPVGVFAELTRSTDGRWTLLFPGLYAEQFDQYGRLTRMQDRYDNHLEFYYDAAGRLAIAMDAMGRLYAFDYYAQDDTASAGRLKSVTDFSERKVEYQYDELGDLRSATLTAAGETRTRAYTYQADANNIKLAHNLVSVTDPLGRAVLQLGYGAEDKVASVTIAGATMTVTPGTNASWTDGMGHARTYAHTAAGNPTSIAIDAKTTTFAYDNPDGLVTSVTHPEGNATQLTYNAQAGSRRSQGDLLSVTSVSNNPQDPQLKSSYGYDPWTNQMTSSRDPKGNVTSFAPNAMGNRWTITAPDTGPVTVNLNKFGQAVSTLDGRGSPTVYSYYSENAPTGDGTETQSMRRLEPDGGGYLASVVVDARAGGDNIGSSYIYNARGTRTSDTDGEGNTVSYQIDGFDQVRLATRTGHGLALPVATSYEFDANGNLTARSERGVSESFTYNTANLPESITRSGPDPESGQPQRQQISMQYDADQKLVWRVDARNIREDYGYDGQDRLATISRASVVRQQFGYDGNSNPILVVDGELKTWTRLFDGQRRPVATIDPLSHRLDYTLDDNSNILTVTGPEMFTQAFAYDGSDRVVESKTPRPRPDGSGFDSQNFITHKYQYDPAGGLSQYFSPNNPGRPWAINRTGSGLPQIVTDPLLNKTETHYDARGIASWTEEQESGGKRLRHTFDIDMLGQTRVNDDDLGRKWVTHVDGQARPLLTTDPEQGRSWVDYDGLGRVRRVHRTIDASTTQTTFYDYDQNNNIKLVRDPLGNETRYEYDDFDRMWRVTYADNTSESYEFDKNDRVKVIHQSNGTTVSMAYDDAGRMTDRTIARAAGVGGPDQEHFEYDGLNRLKLASNGFTITELTYDTASRLIKEVQKVRQPDATWKTNEVGYGYDDNGNRTSITYPSGRVLTITPDALDRISTIKSDGADLASYTYEGADKVVAKQLGPLTMTATHDPGKRPATISYAVAQTQLVGRVNEWNLLNFKKTETKLDENNGLTGFTYDKAWRMTTLAEPAKQTTFTIDAADSIKTIQEVQGSATSMTQFTTNNRHQVTAADGSTLTYDPNGNMATVQYLDGRQVTYTYDWRNQLVKVQDNRGLLVEYVNDALGRRLEKRVGGAEVRRHIYAGWQVIEERDATDQLVSRYAYGNGIDEAIEIEKRDAISGTLKRYYPIQDTNSSVLALVDDTGALVERVQYTPYGKPSFIHDHEQPKVDQVRLADNTLRIRFSEAVDQPKAQVAIKVKQGADILAGTVTFSEADRLAIFTPTTAFPQNQALSVEITTAVEDVSANQMADPFTASFTPTGVNVVVYDRGPPNIQSIRVTANAIKVEFDEELDPASIGTAIELTDDQTGTPVAGTATLLTDRTIQFAPSTVIASPTQHYTLKVKTTATDLTGKPLPTEHLARFIFTGADQALFTAPTEREHATSAVGNVIGFQGREHEPETDLIGFRNRYFSPEVGRFLQADPMGYADSTNLYQGLGNNPANTMDPLGLAEIPASVLAQLDRSVQSQEARAEAIKNRQPTIAPARTPSRLRGAFWYAEDQVQSFLLLGSLADPESDWRPFFSVKTPLSPEYTEPGRDLEAFRQSFSREIFVADAYQAVRSPGRVLKVVGIVGSLLAVIARQQGAENTPESQDPPKPSELVPEEGRVGSYGDLKKSGSVGDNLTPHHVPPDDYMKARGGEDYTRRGGIAINMEQPPTGGRHRQTDSYGRPSDTSLAPRDALARSVWDVRRVYREGGLYTAQIKASLLEVIAQNKSKWSKIFGKGGK